MSNVVQIESVSRRSALKRIAAAVFAGGIAARMDPLEAQHVHQAVANAKGALEKYDPGFFSNHHWMTVRRLAELIVPADETSGSAVDAGAPEFIDLLCRQNEDLANIYYGGLGWLDAEMRGRYGKTFISAEESDQREMLDAIVAEEQRLADKSSYGGGHYGRFHDYQASDRSDLGAGVKFFDWVRKMSIDAFYTSPVGIKDIGYMGNGAYSSYKVPQEAIDYAMKRSPFSSDD